jgi:Ran GTPase-activating protein (RanGAP) involved in mRNA processing and transport
MSEDFHRDSTSSSSSSTMGHKRAKQLRVCDGCSEIHTWRQLKSGPLKAALENMYSGRVQTINLNLVRLDDDSIKFVADALADSRSNVRWLNLSACHISDIGAEYLSEALRVNKTVETLNLDQNDFTNEGVRMLAEALHEVCSPLTWLRLNENKFDDEGAWYLGEALRNNRTLTTLFVAMNNIGRNGALDIADALRSNSALKQLQIGGCHINKTAKDQLRRSWLRNKSRMSAKLRLNL